MNIPEFDPYEFTAQEIEGVPVYYKHLPWAPRIHFRLVFKTGAFSDPVGKEGISHFLEHLIFDGSPTLPDKKAINEWSKKTVLNSWHAWTDFYNTTYWCSFLPDTIEPALTGIRDMVFSPHLREEDVEHERSVITQEAWSRFGNEKLLNHIKETNKILFDGNIRGRFFSALGWPDTITTITGQDIKEWHTQKYGRGNFFIVLCGAVETHHLEAVRKFLAGLPEAKSEKVEFGTINPPQKRRVEKHADEIGDDKKQVEVSIIDITDPLPYTYQEIASAWRRLVHDVLFERLRTELGLCYGVSVSAALKQYYTHVSMNISTDEIHKDTVEKEFWNIIQDMHNREKYQARFETIKQLGIEQVKAQEHSSEHIADGTLSEIENNDGHIVTLSEQLERMEHVTYNDLLAFMDRTLSPDRTFTEVILPTKNK